MARIGLALRTEERDKLRDVLQEIESDVQWFFACSGAISSHDMASIIRDVRRRIDENRKLIYGDK